MNLMKSSKVIAVCFSFIMAAVLFFSPALAAADPAPLPGNTAVLSGLRLYGPKDAEGNSTGLAFRYYLDVVFDESINLNTLQFGVADNYRSVLDYDFITITGQRMVVDFSFFNDRYQKYISVVDSSGAYLSANQYTINTYGIVEIPESSLALTPMYVYDMALYEQKQSTEVLVDSTALATIDAVEAITEYEAAMSNEEDAFTANMYSHNDSFVTDVYVWETEGRTQQSITDTYYVPTSTGTSISGFYNYNNYTVVDENTVTTVVPIETQGIYTVTVNESADLDTSWGDTYSRVTSIDSLSVSGCDIPGGGYYIFSVPSTPEELTFTPSNGSVTYYPEHDLYFNYMVGISTPVSDVSLSSSEVEIISWSHSGDQLLVSCKMAAVEDLEEPAELSLSDIALTLTFSDPEYITKFLYFYVSAYDHIEGLEQVNATSLFDMLKNRLERLLVSVSSIASNLAISISNQTEDLEHGYQNETKNQATSSSSQFDQVTDSYIAAETTINNQVTPYLENFAPDSSSFLALTSSFGMVSGIMTNVYNNLGSFQVLFTFAMTIGICLFLLQLKK